MQVLNAMRSAGFVAAKVVLFADDFSGCRAR